MHFICRILYLHFLMIVLVDSFDRCQPCGENTTCVDVSWRLECSCKKGYTGDPLEGCFKMNENSPCSPNPCGSNSVCIKSDPKLGPHCECEEGLFGWPPNCSEGCSSSKECKETEICNHENKCEELCESSRCGENSVCSVDKNKRTINCSCKEGYIPQPGVGCRQKTSRDDKLLEQAYDSIYGCEGLCGVNAYCGPQKKCKCIDGYQGDPLSKCSWVGSGRVDPCNPNQCGDYSACKVVRGEPICSCVQGFGHYPKYCSKCGNENYCVGNDYCTDDGRCVENACKNFCPDTCNLLEGKVECTCGIETDNSSKKPFHRCIGAVVEPSQYAGVLDGRVTAWYGRPGPWPQK